MLALAMFQKHITYALYCVMLFQSTLCIAENDLCLLQVA